MYDPDVVLPVTYLVDATGTLVWAKAGGTREEIEDIEAIVIEQLGDAR